MLYPNSDIRLKLVAVILFVASVLLIDIQHNWSLVILVGWLAGSIILNRIDPLLLLKKIIRIYPMIFFVTILIPFSGGGSQPESNFLFFKVNAAGLSRFTELNVKLTLILACTSLFGLITSPHQVLSGMQSVGLARWIVAIGFLMQASMTILKRELKSQMIGFRGRYIKMRFYPRMVYFSRMLAVFMVRTVYRSERLYQAMISRGFTGQVYLPAPHAWRGQDTLILGLNLVFSIMVIVVS